MRELKCKTEHLRFTKQSPKQVKMSLLRQIPGLGRNQSFWSGVWKSPELLLSESLSLAEPVCMALMSWSSCLGANCFLNDHSSVFTVLVPSLSNSRYLPLIDPGWLCGQDTGLWLAEINHVTLILASHWSRLTMCRCRWYWPLIGSEVVYT